MKSFRIYIYQFYLTTISIMWWKWEKDDAAYIIKEWYGKTMLLPSANIISIKVYSSCLFTLAGTVLTKTFILFQLFNIQNAFC